LKLTEEELMVIKNCKELHFETKKKILDDYEKARKWDEIAGAHKISMDLGMDVSIIRDMENQKLRELIEEYIITFMYFSCFYINW